MVSIPFALASMALTVWINDVPDWQKGGDLVDPNSGRSASAHGGRDWFGSRIRTYILRSQIPLRRLLRHPE